MENDQPFEADAALEAGDRAHLHSRRPQGLNGALVASAGNGSIGNGTSESDTLLSSPREPPTTWQGENDYVGLTWWQRPSVSSS